MAAAQEAGRLGGALQENLLIILCFKDESCKIVRHAIQTATLFESSVFRDIAGHAIDFIDQFGVAIKDHLPDHLEHILKGEDARKATSYKRVIDSLYLNRESVNVDYVLKQLSKFIRGQNLKSGFVKAAEAFDRGDVDAAEVELQKALSTQVVTFDAGLTLDDPKALIGVLDNLQEPGFNLGIKPFDDYGIIPRRKELLVFMASRGKGKSWFCVHAAKMAMLQRWSPLVVSLEMGQNAYASRFLQSFFSISKREAPVRITQLELNRAGKLERHLQEEVDRRSLSDPDIRDWLSTRARREFGRRPPLIIKEFPTGSLTVDQLEAYLDGLDRFQNFVPDLLIVDYPMLMRHATKEKRVELGQIVERIRGIAVERNLAAIIPWQGNRESEDAYTVRGSQAGEDISILATADTFLTYSRTEYETKLGLARLLVEKCRNDIDDFSAVITQAYAIGQFCLEAVRLEKEYFEVLEDSRASRNKGKGA